MCLAIEYVYRKLNTSFSILTKHSIYSEYCDILIHNTKRQLLKDAYNLQLRICLLMTRVPVATMINDNHDNGDPCLTIVNMVNNAFEYLSENS